MDYIYVLFSSGSPVWASPSTSGLYSYLRKEYAEQLAEETANRHGNEGKHDYDHQYEGDDDSRTDEYGYTAAYSYHNMIDMICDRDPKVRYRDAFLALECIEVDPYDEEYEEEMKADDPDYEPEVDPSLFRDLHIGDTVWVAYFDHWSTYEYIGAFSAMQPNLSCDDQTPLTLQ